MKTSTFISSRTSMTEKEYTINQAIKNIIQSQDLINDRRRSADTLTTASIYLDQVLMVLYDIKKELEQEKLT